MKVVLDTCVLFPTVMRAILLGAAKLGHFTPLWSARILEEWHRAAQKLGPDGPAQAGAEIALLRADWVREFLAGVPAEADIAALLAPEAAVRVAAPEGKRTYLAFRDGRYSGCNLFYLRSEAALGAVALW